jgi:hypothetical protein
MNGLRKLLSTGAAIAAMAGLMVAATPARAVSVNLLDFQLDGDAQETSCGHAFPNANPPPDFLSCAPEQQDDWDSLYSCPSLGQPGACTPGTPGAGNLASVIGALVDEFNFPDTDNFAQGSKDDMNVTAWNWTGASGSAKTNIMQSFAAKYDGSLYIGGNRDINNGDANFGMWLLQNPTNKCTAALASAVAPAPHCATVGTFVGAPDANGLMSPVPHKLGDILVVSAFTNGGTVANIQVYKVIQSLDSNGVPNTSPNAVPGTCPSTAFDGYAGKSTGATGICLQQLITVTKPGTGACNNAVGGVPAGAACAATNAIAVPSLDPRYKSGQSGSVQSQYPALTFFEVGLSLDDLGLQTECFPNYLVNGRQSQSVTSALNDFTLGAFQSCNSGIVTNATASVILGNPISDTATLNSSGGNIAPTGTITFTAYSDNQCTTSVYTSVVTVNAGAGDYNSATGTGGTFTPSNVGTYYWIASYSGDANYPAATGKCGDSGESSVVTPKPTTLTTTASGNVTLGASISDTAHISGLVAPFGGTITFKLWSSQAACVANGTPTFTSTKDVTGNGDVPSNSFTPSATGSYVWTATYTPATGSNNQGATTLCDDGNEVNVVSAKTPGIGTTPKLAVINNDSATLNSLVAGVAPTGTITFTLYQSADCSGASKYSATVPLTNSGGVYGAATSNTTAIDIGSTDTDFRWIVTYNGDTNYGSVTSPCSAEGAHIDITPLAP